MPNIQIYIKETVWSKILKANKWDRQQALRAIRETIEQNYGDLK